MLAQDPGVESVLRPERPSGCIWRPFGGDHHFSSRQAEVEWCNALVGKVECHAFSTRKNV